MRSQAELRERIRALAGFDRVLRELEGLPPVHLVGGAVRDLLRGKRAIDVDLAVEGDAHEIARRLARRTGGEALPNERFGTAVLRLDGFTCDLATTRRERYLHPGALPVVEPAPLEEDLARRDFSVNAMAIGLTGEDLGCLRDPHGGQADLEQRLLRVLHPASFRDDPTRLLRAARYLARLDFRLEDETRAFALDAVADGALATVSGDRIGRELILLLAEESAPAAVEALTGLGADRALHPLLRAEPELVASAQLACLETGGRRELAALAALVSRDPLGLAEWVGSLGLERGPRDVVRAAARNAPGLVTALRGPELRGSELYRLLQGEPPEALAVALALGAPPEPVLRFVHELSGARPRITGADLIAAGVEEGPAIGHGLAAALAAQLDGQAADSEEELAVALEAAGREPS